MTQEEAIQAMKKIISQLVVPNENNNGDIPNTKHSTKQKEFKENNMQR